MFPGILCRPFMEFTELSADDIMIYSDASRNFNKEAIWLYAELFLGHHDGSCHGLW